MSDELEATAIKAVACADLDIRDARVPFQKKTPLVTDGISLLNQEKV